MPATSKEPVPVIRGDRYRRTHKASVIGILGKAAPPVASRGFRFYNRDKWTARFLIGEMCAWAGKHPGCIPTSVDVQDWVRVANGVNVPIPEIVIANTPDKLPLRTAMALTGGAYHEAFHSKYSCRRNLGTSEIANIVLPRWAKVKDWSRLQKLVLEWSNIVEDIRIERRGREDFEGVFVKLCDLQDFILLLEEKGREDVRSHGDKPGALSAITCTFRDIGLGYNTETQRMALDRYRTENPEAVKLVLKGPLSPLLKEAIDLPREDDIGCIRVALDVVAKLAELSGHDEEDDQPQNGKVQCPQCGAPADKIKVRPKADPNGGKVPGVGIMTCTVCGFQTEVPVRPKTEEEKKKDKDEKGPKFEGFDKEEPQQGEQSPQDGAGNKSVKSDKPVTSDKPQDGKGSEGGEEGEDTASGKGKASGKDEDKEGQDGSGGGKEKKDGDDPGAEGDESKSGGKNGKEDAEEDESAGEGKGSKDDGEDAKEEGDGTDEKDGEDKGAEGEEGTEENEEGAEGEEKEGEEGGDEDGGEEGEEGEGKEKGGDEEDDAGENGDGDKDDGEGDGKNKSPAGPQTNGKSPEEAADDNLAGEGAGGFHEADPIHPGNEWEDIAEEALEEAETGKDTGVLDNNTGLEQVFSGIQENETKDVKPNEAAWSPYDPGLDEAILVKPSGKGREHDKTVADLIAKSVKSEVSFLRARLRTIIRSLEMTHKVHGVPKGRGLSQRYLVDSKVSLMQREHPEKAYWRKGIRVDMKMAVAVVVDESGSMDKKRQDSARIMCALSEPFDALNCPTLVLGFRNGSFANYLGYGGVNLTPEERNSYHRFGGVTYDIFKMWDEKFSAIRWRIANTLADGGTPMSDGIQFALDALSIRDEAHRIMFVITDGQPDPGHTEVIQRQIRLAKAAGIHIVGVGLGKGSEYVKTLFKDSVWSETLKDIPKLLLEKLNELADTRGGRRGVRVKHA